MFSATVLTNVRSYTLPFSPMALAKLMWGKTRMPDMVSEHILLHGINGDVLCMSFSTEVNGVLSGALVSTFDSMSPFSATTLTDVT